MSCSFKLCPSNTFFQEGGGENFAGEGFFSVHPLVTGLVDGQGGFREDSVYILRYDTLTNVMFVSTFSLSFSFLL